MMMNLSNDCAYWAKIFTPAFGKPTVEECFKGGFRFQIKPVIAKQPMIRQQWKDNLSWVGNNLMAHHLSLDSTEMMQEVHKHDMVCELRLVIQTVDLVAILGNSSKWNNIVKIESQGCINVVNKCLHILFGALVERNDSKSRTTAAEMLENSLVVFDCGMAIVGNRDDDMSTA